MKVDFNFLFNRAYNALTSGKYPVYSPAEKGVYFVETGFFVARDNKTFPLFKIGSSLIDTAKQKNIYVKRFNPNQTDRQARFNHVLVLTDANNPLVPSKNADAYYFSHHDYLPETFHQHVNLREHRYHGGGYPGQDLSKDGFYVHGKSMYDEPVNLASWHKDTLKYIRDAIETFVGLINKQN